MKFEESIEVDRGSITFGINNKREGKIKIQYIDDQLKKLIENIKLHPFYKDIKNIITVVSEQDMNNHIKLELIEHEKRKFTNAEIIDSVLKIYKEMPSDCRIHTSMATSKYKTFDLFLQVYEDGIDKLKRKYQLFLQDPLINRLHDGILTSDLRETSKLVFLVKQRECAKYNVSPHLIFDFLSSINKSKFFNKKLNEDISKIHLGVFHPDNEDKIKELLTTPIETSYYDPITERYQRSVRSISNFLKTKRIQSEDRRMRINGVNGLGIQLRLKPGVSKSDILNAIEKFNDKQDGSFCLKPDIKEEIKINSMKKIKSLFFIAVLLIYLLLSALFESFISPISILLTVPGAALGSLLGLSYCGQSLNIVSMIGLITLLGLITRHGTMIVDYIMQHKGEKNDDHLVIEASHNRAQAIFMTTFCMTASALSLMLDSKTPFHEYKYPIGIVIFVGMIVGTILSLYCLPCLHLIIEEIYKGNVIKREDYSSIIKSILVNHYDDVLIKKEKDVEEDNNNSIGNN